ncbi:MFS transporter [Salinimonas marina]|uniref:MFS transporter n=1 Tax=Salinimonas marina TaxID=2785918 RepID=A0A7S9DV59_9ALTE|nr:MFS transporter [Salinimonas marina]QPG04524.1 MFS transporter [Salinimonas marina]
MSNNQSGRLVGSLSASKLADLLISAKTTLPALLITLGAPAWMVGWLVPIRESGALLPQAAIGLMLRNMQARHTVWRLGMAVQVLSCVGMLIAAMLLENYQAGWAILGALVLLSLGRSACSLTVKDIEADIAPKGERGNLLGKASTISGLLSLGIAVPLVFFQSELGLTLIIALVALAAAGFFSALLFLLPVKTYIADKKEDNESGSEQHSATSFWQFDSVVYRFVLVRGLFVHSALVAPYFMLESSAAADTLLPLYLAAQAAATMLSSLLWGRLADASAKRTLRVAGIIAVTACIGLLVLDTSSLWLSGLLFFVLSIAHTGVRTGRKTYSLDVKEGQGRTELVAFSNTSIGLILLAFGALYAAIKPFIGFSVVYIMTVVLLLAMALTYLLPDEK